MRVKWLLFYLSFLLSGFMGQTVFAFEFYEETEWLGVDEEPKFCLVEQPDDPDFMKDKQMFISISQNSILGWETALKQSSGNNNAWDIDYEYVRLDDPETPLYTKNCDVLIEFLPAVDNALAFSGVTSVMEKLEIPAIQIGYLEVIWKEEECDPEIYICVYSTDWLAETTGNILTEKRLIPTLQHEMGHAFGLGHYLTNDSLLLDSWDRGLKEPPSLMIEIEPIVGYSEITDLDTEKIFSIYGPDGFAKSKKTVPDWIKNNAEWWSQGLISDEEYLSAIEFLIKEGIIQV